MAQPKLDEQHLIVRIGNRWYGIPLNYVDEVLNLVAVDDLPGAPDYVLGLISLRQRILPVLDLRVYFGHGSGELTLNTPMIALRGEAIDNAVVVVDEVDDVKVTGDSIQHQSDTAYIRGAVQLGNRLVLILNIEEITSGVVNNPMESPDA
ncbi:MAG: chemotaxis protein CheW [Chloroflexota bacterium]